MIYTGTSGYSYEDWKGIFYSREIKDGDMLKAYSKTFNFTEINSTYYKMPNYFQFKNMVEKVPENFMFSVKSHGSFTHSRDASTEEVTSFLEALKPIKERNMLGCILFQFPYSFHKSVEGTEYIKKLRDMFGEERLVFEFRSSEWATGETMELLIKNKIGWVCVDEPDLKGLVKPVVAVTSDIGYVRFHGRNAGKWYNHSKAYERYDYFYSEDEIKEWIPRIRYVEKGSKITFTSFNNHFRAQGAKNASMLKRLLEGSSIVNNPHI